MRAAPVSLPSGDPRLRLTKVDKARLGAEILLTYGRVRWLMYRHPLPDTVELLREHAGEHRVGGGEAELAAGGGWRYGRAVVKILRLLPTDSRCLVRSLVLLTVLARRSARTTLVIGVVSDPEFSAHAWVEHRGEALLEPGPTGDGRLLEL